MINKDKEEHRKKRDRVAAEIIKIFRAKAITYKEAEDILDAARNWLRSNMEGRRV